MPLAPDPHHEDVAGAAPDSPSAAAAGDDRPPAGELEPGARPRAPRSPAYNRAADPSTEDPPRPFRSGVGTGVAPGATARAERLAAGVADAADRAAGGPRSPRGDRVDRSPGAQAADGGGGADGAGRAEGDRPDRRRLHWTMAAVVGLVAIVGVAVVLTQSGPDDTRAATSPPATNAKTGATRATGTGAGRSATTAPPGTAATSAGPTTTVGPSPVAAVETYLAAIRARDCPTMVDMLTPDSWAAEGGTRAGTVASCRQGFATRSTNLAEYDFGAVKLVSTTGDDAVVSVSATRAGQQTRESMHLVRTNGEWKIKLAP